MSNLFNKSKSHKRSAQTAFHYAPQPNWGFNADANIGHALALVFGLNITLSLEPLLDRVSRQPRAPSYLAVCQSIAHLHAPDLAYHVHGDHLVLLLLKNAAGA